MWIIRLHYLSVYVSYIDIFLNIAVTISKLWLSWYILITIILFCMLLILNPVEQCWISFANVTPMWSNIFFNPSFLPKSNPYIYSLAFFLQTKKSTSRDISLSLKSPSKEYPKYLLLSFVPIPVKRNSTVC